MTAEPDVKRYLFRDGEDDYVARVSALAGLTTIDFRTSVMIRRAHWEKMSARDCARLVHQTQANPYYSERPF